jgi:hypothetical protein
MECSGLALSLARQIYVHLRDFVCFLTPFILPLLESSWAFKNGALSNFGLLSRCLKKRIRWSSVGICKSFTETLFFSFGEAVLVPFDNYIYIYPLFIGFSPHCGCWNNCVYLIVILCPQFDQAYTVIRITSAQIDNNLPCSMPSISPFILKVCETPCPTNRDAARCRAASFGARETCPSHLQG